ncbi:MAG: hypothetical protein ACTSQK_09360 [Candidatus Heimdallarchaeota archaeon]
MNGSKLINQSKFCENKPALIESKDVFYNNPPSINSMIIYCFDITCIDDLVITASMSSYQTVKNISKIENGKELRQDSILDSESIYSLYNNDNITFVGMEGDGPYRNVVGYLENSNISSLNKIIVTNLSDVHNIKQQRDNLFLFGIKDEGLYCEIYNISNLQYPSLITEWNLSEVSPLFFDTYRCGLFLDYQFHNNYLYHSTGENKLLVYDLNNVSAPVKVKEFNENYSRVIFQEDLMYGITESKLEILDNSNPLGPVKITSYDINLPKALAVKENIIYVITERELILLEKEDNEIRFTSKYKLKNRVELKFSKIVIEKDYALILTEQYITNVWDTQTDLFVFDITNKFDIDLLYPKIELPFIVQIFFMYLFLYGIPIIFVIVTMALIIVTTVQIVKFSRRKAKKSEEKKMIQEK